MASRNRNPNACRNERTVLSGFVSKLRMALMIRRRPEGTPENLRFRLILRPAPGTVPAYPSAEDSSVSSSALPRREAIGEARLRRF